MQKGKNKVKWIAIFLWHSPGELYTSHYRITTGYGFAVDVMGIPGSDHHFDPHQEVKEHDGMPYTLLHGTKVVTSVSNI